MKIEDLLGQTISGHFCINDIKHPKFFGIVKQVSLPFILLNKKHTDDPRKETNIFQIINLSNCDYFEYTAVD